jgi:hypothetical protein
MKRLFILSVLLLGMSAPAFAGDITITIDPTTEQYPPGYPTFLCQETGTAPCVVFTGTIIDNDIDDSLLFLSSVALDPTVAADDYFTLDNTFYDDVPGAFSGDPAWETDDLGNPSDTYTGPLFGLDFAPDTPNGIYDGMIIFSGAGGTNDANYDGFTVEEPFEVIIGTPEPASGLLMLTALLATGAARRKRSLKAC